MYVPSDFCNALGVAIFGDRWTGKELKNPSDEVLYSFVYGDPNLQITRQQIVLQSFITALIEEKITAHLIVPTDQLLSACLRKIAECKGTNELAPFIKENILANGKLDVQRVVVKWLWAKLTQQDRHIDLEILEREILSYDEYADDDDGFIPLDKRVCRPTDFREFEQKINELEKLQRSLPKKINASIADSYWTEIIRWPDDDAVDVGPGRESQKASLKDIDWLNSLITVPSMHILAKPTFGDQCEHDLKTVIKELIIDKLSSPTQWRIGAKDADIQELAKHVFTVSQKDWMAKLGSKYSSSYYEASAAIWRIIAVNSSPHKRGAQQEILRRLHSYFDAQDSESKDEKNARPSDPRLLELIRQLQKQAKVHDITGPIVPHVGERPKPAKKLLKSDT